MTFSQQSLKLLGIIDNLSAACDFVISMAAQAGLDETIQYQCELSVDEIFTNIVEHGYNHQAYDQFVELICSFDDHMFTIKIVDDAPLFNPLDKETPHMPNSTAELQIGGWGIHFVKRFMSDVGYQIYDGRNCLILMREIPS